MHNPEWQASLLKIATQIHHDWLTMMQHGYKPQAHEPLNLSILPRAAAPKVIRDLRAARGDSDDVLARLSARTALA